VAVLLVVVLGAVGVTAWRVTAAGGDVTPLRSSSTASATGPTALVTPVSGPGAATSAEGTTAPAAPVASAAAASSGTVVVDVAGKVRRPGIATLPAGSRVVDALRAAGGARRGVRLGSLNLARVLADGEQVVVGVPPPGGAAAAAVGTAASGGPTAAGSGAPTPMVDVNTADQTTLEQLPGIGPVTARSILDYRAENGPFASVDDLLGVSGIGDATLAKIAPYVTL
jgi:competence protein ComEA